MGPLPGEGSGIKIQDIHAHTTVRELVGNEAYTEVVLSFLRETDAGKAKAGVLDAGYFKVALCLKGF